MEPRSTTATAEIIVDDRLWNRYVPRLRQLVARALGIAHCGATVVLTDDRTIQRLNARDRRKNKPTNVLTYETPPEILLALGVVRREAAAAARPVANHLAHLIIHGALHLAGFDHHQAGDARRMEAEEARLLGRLHIPNPWKNR